MSIQRKLRRGNKTASDAFTGAEGETVYETDNKRLINHDAVRVGGYPVPNFLDIVSNYFKSASATGTNTLTLTLPYTPGSYGVYEEILFKPQNNNTGAVTINVNSRGARDIKKVDSAGSIVALVANDLKAGIPVRCIDDGTRYIAQISAGSSIDSQIFNSSGTWTKPSAGSVAIILAWGAGASGGKNSTGGNGGGGGGGGAFVQAVIPLSLLGSTETVTIGAGGAAQTSANTAGNAGGDTTFGSWLTAYGGGRGGGGSSGGGGGGGGNLGKGGNATTTTAGTGGIGHGQTTGLTAGQGGGIYGGQGGGTAANPLQNVSSCLYGGGGGGGGSNSAGPDDGFKGGAAYFGGAGGGAGAPSGAGHLGGVSVFGGNGGAGAFDSNNATAGSQPGGGGGGAENGNSGAGGDGKCVVIVL